MKKIIAFLILLLVVSGCGKSNDKSVVKYLKNKVDSCNAYHMKGIL